MPLWDLTPHMVLICMCVMYLCTHSTQLHATVKSQITVSFELPGGAATIKEVHKHEAKGAKGVIHKITQQQSRGQGACELRLN